MIRPFTLITMLLAAGSGAYLFAVKHRAQTLDDQIAHILDQTRQDSGRIIVLQAQWALETDPTRLQQLASQFTNLQPMQPAQLVTLAALRTSLPAPGSAAPTANPELPQALPEVAANAVPGTALENGLPLPPPQAPELLASAAPAPAEIRPRRRVNHSVLAGGQFAEAAMPRRYDAPHPYPLPPAALSSESAGVVPMGAQVMSVKASVSVPQYAPRPTPPVSEDSGSALGMAADLPPPQPLPRNGMHN